MEGRVKERGLCLFGGLALLLALPVIVIVALTQRRDWPIDEADDPLWRTNYGGVWPGVDDE